MRARVMISSVINDEIALGALAPLKNVWFEADAVQERLGAKGSGDNVGFALIRTEIVHHLKGKYDFDVYYFEGTPGEGRAPEEETVREARKSHLIIGIFGSKLGWPVPDQDPLTPTLREWRAALETRLKFKLFWWKNSIAAKELGGELGSVIQAITDYKEGKVYLEFRSAADLFVKIDQVVQDYLNRAIVRYATDTVAKEPSSESERWLLASYRDRARTMKTALSSVARTLGIQDDVLILSSHKQPVRVYSVPDAFSIAEARKFAAYIFDEEAEEHRRGQLGWLPIVCCFRGITDSQIRRHLGNIEATEIYPGPWGFYASEPISGRQCLYLIRCDNSLRMESSLSRAITWLVSRHDVIASLAKRRKQILDIPKD
jgi:hypothetical protein